MLTIIMATGCAGAGGAPEALDGAIAITVLLDARHSSAVGLMPTAVWVDDPRRSIRVLRSNSRPWTLQLCNGAATPKDVLVIYMGRKATGGYHLSLVSPMVAVVRGVAVVQVQWGTRRWEPL